MRRAHTAAVIIAACALLLPAHASDNNADGDAFRIVVLAYDRPASLYRLLRSVAVADYLGHAVHLEIRIDGGSSPRRTAAIEVAQLFHFAHGGKTITVDDAPAPRGLAAAWLRAWHPASPASRAVILEDDLAVSPLFYRYIHTMFALYGSDTSLAGVTLQRHTLCATKGAPQTPIDNDGLPFAYRLVGSWGFAPHPVHWSAFVALDFAGVNPHVPGLITSDWHHATRPGSMWTQYFIWFCERHALYVVYTSPRGGTALATNFREKGAHYASTLGADFPLAQDWDARWEHPTDLPRHAWDCSREPHASVHAAAVSLSRRAPAFVPITFVNAAFVPMTRIWLCHARRRSISTHSLLFAALDPAAFRDLRALGLATVPWFGTAETAHRYGTPEYFELIHRRMHMLGDLLRAGVSLFLFETDQIWTQDPRALAPRGFDVITYDDSAGQRGRIPCGGFLFLNATPATRGVWDTLTHEHHTSMDNEQARLGALLRGVRAHYADFVRNGDWLKKQTPLLDPPPPVVHVNWIIGEDAKRREINRTGLMCP